jgi:ABC-2 type transport system permease protein
MLTQYKALLLREWRLMKKGYKKFIGIMLIIPIVFTLLFAYAINLDAHHLPTAVFNQSPREESRDLLAVFRNTGYFDIQYAARSYQEVTDLIESGRAKVGIIIPPDFTDNLKHGRSTAVQVVVDDSDFRNVNAAKSVAQLIGQAKLQEMLAKKMQSIAGKQSQPPFEVRLRNWYNMEGDSTYSILPSATCAMLLLTLLLSFSLSVVTDRQRGMLERFRALNVGPLLYFSAKAVPYVLGAFVQLTVLLAIQIFCFDLPFRGNVLLLYLIAGIYVVTCLGIALLVAKVSANHFQTIPWIMPIFLFSMLLGGFIGPRSGVAEFLYWCGYAIPMTYFLDIMRGIMLKGVGIMELWTSLIGLSIYCTLVLALVNKNKKQLGDF